MWFTGDPDVDGTGRPIVRSWWLYLVTGIIWTVIGFFALAARPGTAALIGLLAGVVLLLAGIDELGQIPFLAGWRWLHGVLGVLMLIAGVMALLSPFQTFGILAVLIAWYLLFKGLADIVVSVVERAALPAWGLLLGLGIVQVVFGVWALSSPTRSVWLLVLWVGTIALIRGISEIVLAMNLRRLNHQLALT
jgi:uncharacterized membrane protein HdeD (DUF308 family)